MDISRLHEYNVKRDHSLDHCQGVKCIIFDNLPIIFGSSLFSLPHKDNPDSITPHFCVFFKLASH